MVSVKEKYLLIFFIIISVGLFWFADYADRESGCTWSIWDQLKPVNIEDTNE